VKSISIPLLILMAAALLAAGCSQDDPVKPVPEPVPDPVATSPDSLMSLYRTALEAMDADLYDTLLGADFHLLLSPFEGDFGDLPTAYLTRNEANTAAGNMFAGQPVTNWQGDGVPGVTRFTIHDWSREGEWLPLPIAGSTPVPPPYEMRRGVWSLRMFVERGTSYPLLSVAGRYAVTVGRLPAEGSDDPWFLVGIEPVDPVKSETFGWAGVNLHYLTNEPPTAVLAVEETAGDPWPDFTFDPAGSSDDDSGLAPLPYRYRIGGEPLMPPEDWSAWTDQPFETFFRRAGEHTVTLEVRDRWGATVRAERTVAIRLEPLPFAGTPDQVVANFRTAYEMLAVDHLDDLTGSFFRMELQQTTIDRYPAVGPTVNSFEESVIHRRMFSGREFVNDEQEVLPPVAAVEFQVLDRSQDWEETMGFPFQNTLMAHYDVDILFHRGDELSTLRTRGQIRFHVAGRDSFYEGEDRTFYEMVGQVDLTTEDKALEAALFGDIKARYWLEYGFPTGETRSTR